MNSNKKYVTKTFFIVSYTLITFIFSIAISSLSSQIKKFKANTPEFNKILSIETDTFIDMDILKTSLAEQPISLILGFPIVNDTLIETYLISNYQIPPEDLKSGRAFIKEDFLSDKNIAMLSTLVDEPNIDILENNELKNVPLDVLGITYSKTSKIIIPNKLFSQSLREKNLTREDNIIRISGNPKDIEKTISIIKDKILKNTGTVNVYDYFVEDVSAEWEFLMYSTFLVLLIAFMNSLGISTFIIEDARKAIGIKKICGASNFELCKEFFSDFKTISMTSFIIALLIHSLLALIFNGYIFTLNIKISLINIIGTFVIINLVMILNLVPFFIKLKNINPIDTIKEI